MIKHVIHRVVAILGVLMTFSGPVSAENRWYGGATASSARVGADEVEHGGSSSAGAFVGFRLTRHLALEVELGRGQGELSRAYSGEFMQFARETPQGTVWLPVTMERQTRWKPTSTWSALVVATTPPKRRVGLGAFLGITSTTYDVTVRHTVLDIAPGLNMTPDQILSMFGNDNGPRARGGLTTGVMLPIAITRGISIAPEVRYTFGSFGDERYTMTRAGARVLWGF